MADQKINGALYRSMVIEGALAIAEKKEQANELNVFPVRPAHCSRARREYCHRLPLYHRRGTLSC